jgi:hypothetical protein
MLWKREEVMGVSEKKNAGRGSPAWRGGGVLLLEGLPIGQQGSWGSEESQVGV